jgi:ribosomal protein S18 acetylase RimI-like enzyme
MSARSRDSERPAFRIEPATEEDWPWIVQGEGEIVWVRLGRERQEESDRQTIEARVAQRAAKLREDEGFPNQAFVARADDEKRAGFVWVARTHNDSTGRVEASLLSQYVAEPYRGRGLGHRLLETAEEWARQQGLPRISLSVGADNMMGRRLYECLGYQVETLRMTKKLSPQEPDELLLAND